MVESRRYDRDPLQSLAFATRLCLSRRALAGVGLGLALGLLVWIIGGGRALAQGTAPGALVSTEWLERNLDAPGLDQRVVLRDASAP